MTVSTHAVCPPSLSRSDSLSGHSCSGFSSAVCGFDLLMACYTARRGFLSRRSRKISSSAFLTPGTGSRKNTGAASFIPSSRQVPQPGIRRGRAEASPGVGNRGPSRRERLGGGKLGARHNHRSAVTDAREPTGADGTLPAKQRICRYRRWSVPCLLPARNVNRPKRITSAKQRRTRFTPRQAGISVLCQSPKQRNCSWNRLYPSSGQLLPHLLLSSRKCKHWLPCCRNIPLSWICSA